MAGQITLTGYSDEPFQVYNNTFVRDGYEFTCWNTKKDGTGTNIYPNLLLDVQKDTTIYALWKLLYKYMYLIRSGNLNIQNNVTQFSHGDNDDAYEYTPVNVDWTASNSFEFMFKIMTPKEGENTNKQVIFGMQNNRKFNLVMENFNIKFELTGTSSSLNLNPSTTYYIKFVKNAINYTVSYSTDGNTYASLLTASSTETITGAPLYIGRKYKRSYQESYSYELQVADYGWVATTPKYKDVTTTSTTTLQVPVTNVLSGWDWVTTSKCCYYDKTHCSDGLPGRMNHATDRSKKLSNNCGYWDYYEFTYTTYVNQDVETTTTSQVQDGWNYEYQITGYHNETKWSTRTAYDYGYTFAGSIDFNRSYIVLNGIKHKLKA